MFDVLKIIHHIKMLSEMNTSTLCRYMYIFALGMGYLLSNFYSLIIKTTETTVLKKK